MTEQTVVDLDDLVGEHKLSGVDMLDEKGEYGSAAVINFVLDGKTHTAVEDPDDGYRSALDKVFVSDKKVVNMFKPVKVLGVRKTGHDDTIQFLDSKNGKLILEVGTDNNDDYYPSFVGNWTPENMAVNEDKAK